MEAEMDDWVKRMVECLAPDEIQGVRVEEAISIKYQNRPKSVFKYRRNCERSRSNLENNLVWVCSPDEYNDPYDSGITIQAETLTKTVILQGVKEIIAGDLATILEVPKIEGILNASNPALALQEFVMADMDHVPPEQRGMFSDPLGAQIKAWEETFEKVLSTSYKSSLKICSFSETQISIICGRTMQTSTTDFASNIISSNCNRRTYSSGCYSRLSILKRSLTPRGTISRRCKTGKRSTTSSQHSLHFISLLSGDTKENGA